jgi:hypothetical protein
MRPPAARSPAVIVLAAIAGAEALALVAATLLWQPAFRGMFADFGTATLPLVTRLVLGPAWPLGAAAVVVGLTAAAVRARGATRRAVVLLIAALVVGAAAGAAMLVGTYLPIFEVSRAIRVD